MLENYGGWVVRNRLVVLVITLVMTLFLGVQLRNLTVIVDADELLPRDHPFVVVTERVQEIFGNRFTVVIGVTPKSGDVFTPDVLGKVVGITQRLMATPGVAPGNIQSLAAPRAKDISGNSDGLVVSRLLDTAPTSLAQAQAIRARLAANPAYRDVLVSRDGRTAAIYVEFRKDPKGFGHVMDKVEAAIAPARDSGVTIAVAGQPVFLAALEVFSKRMGLLLPVAILVIGLIHLEAFRTLQGLVLPLVTAVLALVWSLGIMTLAGVHLDPFNNITPVLILAVAAGHAVQMLKRYYEEFDARADQAPRDASRAAVVATIAAVGPVLIAACVIAALSFISLIVFDIQAIRTFGIFCGLGILSIGLVELTFTPALRAMLPPPRRRELAAEQAITNWDRLAGRLAAMVATPGARRRVFIVSGIVLGLLLVLATQVHIDNSVRNFFGADLAQRQDDAALNRSMAGTNTFYVLVEGQTDDAIKDPAVLAAMERTQAFLAAQPGVGHTLSIVDLLKQMGRGLNGGGAAAGALPATTELVSQYLLLYSMSGEPGDFDGLVDYPYRNAVIQAFVKSDSSAWLADLNARLLPEIRANFPPGVTVRLGGSVTTPTAMNDVMINGKIRNIIQIFAVVLVVSSLLFRSLRLGLLILVPLLATLLAVFGAMGGLGIPLQIATSTMAALALGIGADYAIYLTWRLREELRRSGDEALAVRTAFATAGKAVLFVASAVAGGYAVLMASVGFNIHIWLGLLTTIAMLAGAISTLTLYAALLLTVRPAVVFNTGDSAVEAPAPAGKKAVVASSIALLLAAVAGVTLPAGTARAAEPPNAAALMAQSLRATRPAQALSIGHFILTNAAGQSRVRETSSLSQLLGDGIRNRRVTRFSAPADIAGTAVLTIENDGGNDDIWVFLPALKKVRRLTAAARRENFVGTDFSYGDVIGHPVAEWTHQWLRRETVAGTDCDVVVARPRDPGVTAATGYGRRVLWLRSADQVPIKTEYYDAAGALMKVYEASDIKLVDPARRSFQPMRQLMRNLNTGHRTAIEYTSFRTNVKVADADFQPRALETAR